MKQFNYFLIAFILISCTNNKSSSSEVETKSIDNKQVASNTEYDSIKNDLLFFDTINLSGLKNSIKGEITSGILNEKESKYFYLKINEYAGKYFYFNNKLLNKFSAILIVKDSVTPWNFNSLSEQLLLASIYDTIKNDLYKINIGKNIEICQNLFNKEAYQDTIKKIKYFEQEISKDEKVCLYVHYDIDNKITFFKLGKFNSKFGSNELINYLNKVK